MTRGPSYRGMGVSPMRPPRPAATDCAWARRPCHVLCAILALWFTAPVARAQVDPKAVDDAIAKAKVWLYSQQKDGNWERSLEGMGEHGDQKTGYTALVTYALLAAGENHNDPRIQRAVEFLMKNDATGVYALGMRCQVWYFLPQSPDVKASMRKDAKLLLESVYTDGKGKGFYNYNPGGSGAYSHSRGHYGVLGVWAAAQTGVSVPDSYWQLVERAWVANQDPSGGWTYAARAHTTHPLTPNMTASAVATLFITQDYIHANEGITGRGNIRNPAIEKGIKWLAENFNKVATDEKIERNYPYNTMYGIERVGVASGYKYIADIDWFTHGAKWLLKNQKRDGSWPAEYGDLTSTSFAVIFLARGRAPVAMNKLDYAGAEPDPKKQGPWNQRPRDVANVVRWIGRQSERDLNWQIINTSSPLSDFLDAPILYISGSQALSFDDSFKARVKQYVEQGGLVVGNADNGKGEFAAAFRKLGQELFPAYEFRELPAEHVIYTNQQFARDKWKTKPGVLGLSNGVRELMLLFPQSDPAKTWQLQLTTGREEVWQLAADVLLYSIDKQNLRNKGETYSIARDESVKAEAGIKVARLQYAGNWDPEPGGWQRLANLVHNRHKVDLDVQPVNLAGGSLDEFKVAHLTGTTRFTFNDAARKQILRFIDRGGVIIVDAAGGSSDFAQAAEAELTKLFPQSKLRRLDPGDRAFILSGDVLRTFKYRSFAQRVVGELKDAPRLMVLEHAGRPVVYFSREDLSAGLVGQPVDGIVGYQPETASEIMLRLVLSVPGAKGPLPAPRPTTTAAPATTTAPAAPPPATGSATAGKAR